MQSVLWAAFAPAEGSGLPVYAIVPTALLIAGIAVWYWIRRH